MGQNTLRKCLKAVSSVSISLLLVSCGSSRPIPRPSATLDVYFTEEDFYIIVERGSYNAIAVRYNINPLIDNHELDTGKLD